MAAEEAMSEVEVRQMAQQQKDSVPVNRRALLGRRGEDAAAGYLIRLGWIVLDRNWRCTEGELDIVARDRSDLVICEVKTRSGTAFGAPIEAITPAKAARLRRLASRWAAIHGYAGATPRIDVIGLLAGGMVGGIAGGPGRFAIDHFRGVC
jgi:putative endonuclease